MSVHDEREFRMLARAMALGELTAAEGARVRELAAGVPARERELHEYAVVHAWLGRERRLHDDVARPVEPHEAGDETFVRLERTAVLAGERLTAHLLHPAPPHAAIVAPRRRARIAWAAAAVLLAAFAVWFSFRGAAGPDLLDGRPDDRLVAGAIATIRFADEVIELHDGARVVSWRAARGADRYDSTIAGPVGGILLQRPEQHAKSTDWELTESQLAILRQATTAAAPTERGLIVQVTGFAHDGSVVARSAATDLRVR
jgi:hypothetical protein